MTPLSDEEDRYWVNDTATVNGPVTYAFDGPTDVAVENWVQIVDQEAGGIAYASPAFADDLVDKLNKFDRAVKAAQRVRFE